VQPAQQVRFGTFEVDFETGELRKRGIRIRLQEKPLLILRNLLERPGELVTREELRAKLWSDDTFVDFEGSLNAAILKLRRALGDSAGSPRFIETLPKRGYRFIAPVQADGGVRDLSLAVLPFRNASGDAEDEYFADGLTEELIAATAQIEGLRVVSRRSAFFYKGAAADIRELGQKLSVGHVLEGSVRRSQSRFRIRVELTEIAAGYVVWSKRYDRDATGIFDVQEDVAQAVAQSLESKLQPQPAGLIPTATTDSAAHGAYLQGKHQWNRWTPDGWRRALTCFQEAVNQQPDYAPAWAALSRAHSALGGFGLVRPRGAFPLANQAARRAIELKPEFADGYGALAECAALYDWDFEESERLFEQAFELDPASPVTRDAYAGCCLLPQGRFEQAQQHLARALETDPLSPRILSYQGLTSYITMDFGHAERALRKALELHPGYDFALSWLGMTLLKQDRHAEALAAFESTVELTHRDPAALAFLGYAQALAGRESDAERILEEIDRASGQSYLTRFHSMFVRVGLGQLDEAQAELVHMEDEKDPYLPLARVLPFMRIARVEATSQPKLNQ